jgi:hypothetical protein
VNTTKLYGIEVAVDAGSGASSHFFVYHVTFDGSQEQQFAGVVIGPLLHKLHS